MERYQQILNFWFDGIDENTVLATVKEKTERWFKKDEAFDQKIKKMFEADVTQAAQGAYKTWADDYEGLLALVILLDQFPRNIYRGSARAFDYDLKALEFSLKGIKSGYDKDMSIVQKQFLYMPLMHSEHLEVQRMSVEYYGRMLRLAEE